VEESNADTAVILAHALADNTHLHTLFISNCSVNNEGARQISEVLLKNKTLTVLNLETNRITGDGIKHIAEAIAKSTTLVELKLTNQVQLIGSEAERELATACDQSQSLQKLTLTGRDQSARNVIERATMRNKENARKARVAAKKAAEAAEKAKGVQLD